MITLRQRFRGVGGRTQVQDIAEYAVMLGVILLLVFGTLKVISGKHRTPAAAPQNPTGTTK